MNVGDKVTVLAPFTEFFPDTYVIASVTVLDSGTVIQLDGIDSAFDPKYLQVTQ